MPDTIAYWNGDWVPFSQVKIHPHDRGFMVADTVFDVAADLQRQGVPVQGARGPAVQVPQLRPSGPAADAGGDAGICTRRRWRGTAHFLPEVGGLRPLALRDQGPRPLGQHRRAGQRLHRRAAHRLRAVPALHAGRRPRRHRQVPQLLAPGPGPQDQALQPHELQPRRAGGEGRGPRTPGRFCWTTRATSRRAPATTCSS